MLLEEPGRDSDSAENLGEPMLMSPIQRIGRAIRGWRLDQDMRDVTRGAGTAFALKIIGTGLAFAFNVAIGRLLGADGAGLFFLALSMATIGSVLGRVGLDNALLRFTAIDATCGKWEQVAGVYVLGMKVSFVASASIALSGFLAAPWIASVWFRKPELGEPLRWMSLSILPLSLLNLQAQCLKGVRRIRDAMLVQSVGLPLIGIVLIGPLARAAGVTGVSLAYLLAASVVVCFAAYAWHVALAVHVPKTARFSWPDLLASCKPLFVTAFMNQAILPWASVLLLGLWASTTQVGIYGAASRVAMLVSFALATVNSVVVPKLAELHAKGDMQQLARIARRSALFVTLMASPLFVVVIVESRWVMGIFGSAFQDGGLALAVLAAGQLINALTGSVNHILIITGNESVVRNVTVLAAAFMLLLCLVLAPLMGALGVAIATASATAGLNLSAAFVVWKRLGVITLPFVGRAA